MLPPEQSGVLSLTIRLSREIQRLIKSYFRFNKRHVGQIKAGWGGVGGQACSAAIWRLLSIDELEGALCGWLRRRDRPSEHAVLVLFAGGKRGRREGRHTEEN